MSMIEIKAVPCSVCKNTGRHDRYCPNRPVNQPIGLPATKPANVITLDVELDPKVWDCLSVEGQTKWVNELIDAANSVGRVILIEQSASPLKPKHNYGVQTDYAWSATHKRQRITVWSGSFYSTYEAEGLSLPNGAGFMLSIYDDGEKVRVSCPSPRTDDNYREVDAAIAAALADHYKEMN